MHFIKKYIHKSNFINEASEICPFFILSDYPLDTKMHAMIAIYLENCKA